MTDDAAESAARKAWASLVPGARVAERYELVAKLGEGGMGAVFEALHVGLDRRVALKVLRPEVAHDAAFVERFKREAKITAAVRHASIVEVFDVGSDAALCYLAMELLHGESLQALMTREKKLPAARALALMEPVLAALSHAHSLGVVHRDVKPDNVFLCARGSAGEVTPRLLDFGVACLSAKCDTRLTASGVTLGTPAYMAPEQAWSSHNVGAAADQWSAAAVLYECLSGHLPHESEGFNELIVRRATEPVRLLGELAPDLDPALCDVVMRALAADPSHRFASIDDFATALRPFREVSCPAHTPPDAEPPVLHGAPSLDRAQPSDAPSGSALAAAATGPTVPELPALAPPRASTDAKPGTPHRAWRRVGVALAVVLAGVALRSVPTPTTPAPSRPAALPVAPRTEPDEMATFRFEFQPTTALIFLDGDRLGAGHAAVQRPRDGRARELRVEAPGYEPFRDVVVARGDLTVSRSLVPRDAGTAIPVTAQRPQGAPRPPSPRTLRAPGGRPLDTQWVSP